MNLRWDIRAEETTGFSSVGTTERVLSIRYRPKGSRGRFQSFVVVPPWPDPERYQELVDAYEDKRGKKR